MLRINKITKQTVADARWFPLRYDRRADQFHFAWIPADHHAALTFIADFRPEAGQLRAIARTEVPEIVAPQLPTHLILHSGLSGSTLLARAMYQPGAVITLKEPPIYTDVIAYGIYGGTREQVAQLTEVVTTLMARRHDCGGAIVIKMNSVGNSLIANIARSRANSQILCLHAPLERFLVSLASKGSDGRLGARKLYTGMRNAGLTGSIVSASDEEQYSDLQLAAAAWLAIQHLIHQAASEFGSTRVRSILSEQLFSKPRESLEAIATHFNLELDVESRLASGVFNRHSKTGLPLDSSERRRRYNTAFSVHEQEIRQTTEWAAQVADAAGVPCGVPYPLLS